MFRFFMLILCVGAQEYSCDDFCYCGFNSAQCVNIRFFPRFESTNWIESLYISDSSLKTIPVFRTNEYRSLKHLVFVNCPNINCEIIMPIHRPGLNITLDYDCTETTTEATTNVTTEDASRALNTSATTAEEIIYDYAQTANRKKQDATIIVTSATGLSLIVIIGIILTILIRKFKRSQVGHSTYDDISTTTEATAL